MQLKLVIYFEEVSIQLFIVLTGPERSENLCMEREQPTEYRMCYTDNSFMQEPQYADVSAQFGRSEIIRYICRLFA